MNISMLVIIIIIIIHMNEKIKRHVNNGIILEAMTYAAQHLHMKMALIHFLNDGTGTMKQK